MKSTHPDLEAVRTLRGALALLATDPGAPRLDVEWLMLRCDDTLSFAAERQRASLRQLVADVEELHAEHPGILSPSVLGPFVKAAP